MTQLEDELPAGRRPRLRRLTVAAVSMGVLGLLVLGAGLGQLLWPAHVTEQVVVSPASSETPGSAATIGQFPHVLGLDVATARAVIASAGFTQATVVTESVPASGPKDFVVRQDPAPYARLPLSTDRVTMTLSEPVTMPNLVGKSAEDAKRAVTDLFGVPQLVRVTTADQPAGVVLSTEPAAGAAMPVNVTVNVSDGGDSLSLLALNAVGSSRCDKAKDLSINGQQQTQALACWPGTADKPAYTEYAIGRHATFLDATVGMLDTAAVGTGTIRILGDGKVLATQEVRFGTAEPLHVTIRNVLRLRIEVSGPTSNTQPKVVLGGVRLVGNPDQLDQIES